MYIPDKLAKASSLRAEDSLPVILAEGFIVNQGVGGDVAILTDVGDNRHQEFLLVCI